MCSPFGTHLDELRRLDRDHKYTSQLIELHKQHKFVLLRCKYGGDYETEMRRSLLVNRLFLIYEKLYPRPVVRLDTKPIATHNDRLECCPSCKGTFVLLQDTSDLCCTQCGRLEEIFGAIFGRQYLYTNYKGQIKPKRRSTKSYNFKYYLNRVLNTCKGWAQLSSDQITQANDTFAFIESYLPKRISYPFVAWKILDSILPQGKQRLILVYLKNKNSSKHKTQTRTRLELHVSRSK